MDRAPSPSPRHPRFEARLHGLGSVGDGAVPPRSRPPRGGAEIAHGALPASSPSQARSAGGEWPASRPKRRPLALARGRDPEGSHPSRCPPLRGCRGPNQQCSIPRDYDSYLVIKDACDEIVARYCNLHMPLLLLEFMSSFVFYFVTLLSRVPVVPRRRPCGCPLHSRASREPRLPHRIVSPRSKQTSALFITSQVMRVIQSGGHLTFPTGRVRSDRVQTLNGFIALEGTRPEAHAPNRVHSGKATL